MSRVVFVSGWAGYPELFPRLSALVEFVTPFSDGSEAEVLENLRQGGEVLMAWSTGAHLVLKHRGELFARWRRVVLLSPFMNFCVHVPRATVQRMRDTILAEGPERTVRAFWRNCAAPRIAFSHGDDTRVLAAGLDYLLESCAIITPGESGANVRIVHGADDAIVPASAGSDVAALLAGSWRSLMAFGHYPSETILLGILYEETGRDAFQPGW
ncbi:MAG: alpha/beta hydrolase [Proteobacteria bacterium]|nr:alpha/beta hydrolase [Pseudomonadota bacterium]